MLVDSHCHLNYPDFANLEPFLQRAADNDVQIMQTISTKRSDFAEVKDLAEAHENIYCSIGVHPHEAKTHQDVTVEELLEQSTYEKVIAIGETGLDYFYEHSPREEQQKLFRIHIEAARKLDLPVIVHTRDADDDTIQILAEEMRKGEFKFLIHCFSSTRYLAEKSVELGGYVSLSGILTFKKATEIQETGKALPLDRILVETDAPYLAPVPHRGKPNEPAFTRHTAEFLADLRGISYDEVASATTDNFFKLFSKAKG
jgi:TatD DNase family protein